MTLTLATLLFFLVPNSARAITTNTFSCKNSGPDNCVLGTGDCAQGYSPDPQKCVDASTPGVVCMTKIFQCKQTIVTNYRCDSTQKACVADAKGPYPTFNLCTKGCSFPATPTPIPYKVNCGAGDSGINTAIGCIPMLGGDNGEAFYGFILKWAIGIAGGIAFLLIVYAGFTIMTSSGNPDRLKAGQELLTSAIEGLVLLILCVFILNLIGVKILQLPGLTQ